MIKSQMAQEERMDFKALKAKFQDEDLLLKQPKSKPAVPEKPKVKVVLPPPPQSPTHYLPAGARPSLLSSINQSLDGKSSGAPRVVFKENKKDSKKPLIPPDSKKDKNEGKVKKSKEKTIKVRKEKVSGDSSDQKQKNGKVKKESTLDLVPATPPPKAATAKKGFLGFKMTSKRGSAGIQSESILDTLSSDVPGQVPLIPVPSDFGDRQPGPETSTPKALLPNIPNLPGSGVAAKVTPPIVIPASPDFTPPPAFIPDFPVPLVSPPESETPLKLESPSLPVYQPESPDENILSLLSILPSPPPSFASPCFPPVASPPSPAPPAEPEIAAEAFVPDMEKSPFPVIDPPPATPSPKAQHPISALSALGRAEDMSPGKRTPSSDLRIFNALEKARRKKPSTLTSPNTTRPPTPLPEEEQSPPIPGLDLPPIDYEDQARKALSKPAQVNGLDHEQAAPVLEGISEEVSESIPELMVVPPPPPKRPLPDLETLGPPPEKPRRPPSVNLSEFLPPPHLEDFVVHADPQLSQPGSTDQPEFGEGVSGAHSPELPVADWANGEITGPDSPDGENLPEFYTNGMTTPVPEIQAEPVIGNQDYPGQQAEIWAQVDNGVYESTENVYEDIPLYAIKKKGKNDGGKKRKGPPKNPYVEAAQEANEEKSKTGRFSKNDKKALAEGPDEKELKKKEKQRLEKEKKEQKEKQEREKKEQKEREKKENEMKKKFKITGQEEAIYEAKVTVTNKGRKNDLPVKDGDVISIIRTTNCPKGKWLAKDGSNNYGYVTVDHVELDIKEMLELGKKAASNHRHSSSIVEAEITSTGNRASNHYPMSAESFTDDSEEWTADDDEPQSPPAESADALAPIGHARTLSNPETGNRDLTANHQHSRSDTSTDGPHVQARHQALQKLATFFHASKPLEQAASSTEADAAPVLEEEEAFQLPEASPSQEIDFDSPDMIILPPPELYADMIEE